MAEGFSASDGQVGGNPQQQGVRAGLWNFNLRQAAARRGFRNGARERTLPTAVSSLSSWGDPSGSCGCCPSSPRHTPASPFLPRGRGKPGTQREAGQGEERAGGVGNWIEARKEEARGEGTGEGKESGKRQRERQERKGRRRKRQRGRGCEEKTGQE